MRIFLGSIGVLALAAFSGMAPARAADATLTGQMAPFSYLVGSWNCTTQVPAMNGQPAHSEPTTVTFEVVPGNAFHDHVASADYAGDDYFGYADKMKTYWSASADSTGAHGTATSPDGKTYTGTSAIGPMSMTVTSTYTRVSENNVTFHEVISGAGQQATIDSSCTR
ncbi:MAG: hypothetical protein WB615_01210 [Candidatus Tumulicola sp.]